MTDQTTGDTSRLVGDRYALTEQIGRGGMAEVWSARDTRLGRSVAIKLLRTDLARDPSFQARFKREAQSSASLNHPSIVSVYDTGEDMTPDPYGAPAPQPYIVMEQVHGRTVKQVLQQNAPLDVDDALRITAGVLDALAYSHRAGIIHRDIKPANVMVTDSGEIKVMDFGIARALADTSATMTGTNAVLGTAQYLSPEQARGETVDIRSDLYSAGCLLYELLAARPPFVGDNPLALAYQHVGETPQPPSSLNPEVPDDLDTVVLHALAKSREDRYQDADEFIADLDRVATGLPVVGPGAGGVGDAAGAVAGAAAAAALGSAFADSAATSRLPRAAAAPAAFAAEPRWSGRDDTNTIAPARYEDDDRRSGRVWLYALLVIAALAVIGVAGYFLTRPTAEQAVVGARMPDVVGALETEARAELGALGFTDITSQPDQESDQEPGTVTAQDPEQSVEDLPLDTPILLTIAAAPGQVPVPSLEGLTQVEARNALAGAGLALGLVETADDPVTEAGLVLSSEPAANSPVDEGTEINIVLASGDFTVPPVIGQDQVAAIQALTAAGFDATTQPAESPEAPGTVIDQGDTQDSQRPIGSTITLTVAVAPQPSVEPSTQTETVTPSPSPTATGTGTPTSDPSVDPTANAAGPGVSGSDPKSTKTPKEPKQPRQPDN